MAFALSLAGRPLYQPIAVVRPLRALLGVAIGTSFTPDLLAKIPATSASLALMLPYTALMAVGGTVLLRYAARFDRSTAFFAAAPGGLSDMVLFAHAAGADLRRVTLVHAARVMAIVFALPFWLQFVGGLRLGAVAPQALHVWQLPVSAAVLIGVVALFGWWAATRLGVFGASIIGPMVVCAALHMSELIALKVPIEALIAAQISIGIMIGRQFNGISLREFVTVLSWGLVYAALLLIAAAGMTMATASTTGLDPTTLLVSFAPGGQNEMAVIAMVLGLDVAVVALHHVVRVVVVLFAAQLMFKASDLKASDFKAGDRGADD